MADMLQELIDYVHYLRSGGSAGAQASKNLEDFLGSAGGAPTPGAVAPQGKPATASQLQDFLGASTGSTVDPNATAPVRTPSTPTQLQGFMGAGDQTLGGLPPTGRPATANQLTDFLSASR